MSDREDGERDDGKVWGFMEHGQFVAVPKAPLLRAGYGPPLPFPVEMFDGSIRTIMHAPNETP